MRRKKRSEIIVLELRGFKSSRWQKRFIRCANDRIVDVRNGLFECWLDWPNLLTPPPVYYIAYYMFLYFMITFIGLFKNGFVLHFPAELWTNSFYSLWTCAYSYKHTTHLFFPRFFSNNWLIDFTPKRINIGLNEHIRTKQSKF